MKHIVAALTFFSILLISGCVSHQVGKVGAIDLIELGDSGSG